jgi:hypothetical protein
MHTNRAVAIGKHAAADCSAMQRADWSGVFVGLDAEGTQLSRCALLLTGTAKREPAAAHLDDDTDALQKLQHK